MINFNFLSFPHLPLYSCNIIEARKEQADPVALGQRKDGLNSRAKYRSFRLTQEHHQLPAAQLLWGGVGKGGEVVEGKCRKDIGKFRNQGRA